MSISLSVLTVSSLSTQFLTFFSFKYRFKFHDCNYVQVCSPCSLNYSLILKLETLAEDSAWLFDRLGLAPALVADWHDIVGQAGAHVGPGGTGHQPTSTATNKTTSLQYFGEIPPSKLKQLYTKYRPDFEMFGYSAEPYLSTHGL